MVHIICIYKYRSIHLLLMLLLRPLLLIVILLEVFRACQNILVHSSQILASVIKHRAQWLVLYPNEDEFERWQCPRALHTRSTARPCKHQPWPVFRHRPGNTGRATISLGCLLILTVGHSMQPTVEPNTAALCLIGT